MATRNGNGKVGELTLVPDESTSIPEIQSKSIVRRRKEEIVKTTDSSTAATAIEELEVSFDPDLRMAIIARLVRDKALIKSAATQERQISQALELARIEAIDLARREGKALARTIIQEKKKQQKANAQKQFVEVELPQLLDSCDCLPYESMKKTVNEFAAHVGVKLEWKELENGEYECVPSIIGG